MILKDDFYKINSRALSEDKTSFTITLNPNNIIYKAHFPDKAVTPGVCIVQIANELLQEMINTSLTIVKIKNVKFLSVISPNDTPQIVFQFEKIQKVSDNHVKAQVMVMDGEERMAKISFESARKLPNRYTKN